MSFLYFCLLVCIAHVSGVLVGRKTIGRAVGQHEVDLWRRSFRLEPKDHFLTLEVGPAFVELSHGSGGLHAQPAYYFRSTFRHGRPTEGEDPKEDEEPCVPPSHRDIVGKGDRYYFFPDDILKTNTTFDACIVPSGGVLADGTPNEHSRARLDAVGRLGSLCRFIVSSGSFSPMKAVILDKQGQPVGEGRSGANYLIEKWKAPGKIVLEERSKDSIGNAFFTREIIEHLELQKVLVVTNRFHMLRIRTTFDTIFGLEPQSAVELHYLEAADAGLTAEEHLLREAAEKERVRRFWCVVQPQIATMNDLTRYMYLEHQAYSLPHQRRQAYDIPVSDRLRALY